MEEFESEVRPLLIQIQTLCQQQNIPYFSAAVIDGDIIYNTDPDNIGTYVSGKISKEEICSDLNKH